jgi:hypothetical protein
MEDEMKKLLCLVVATTLACASTFACDTCGCKAGGDPGNIGVGYQGLLLGDLVSGVAVRSTPAPVGFQGELLQGFADLGGGLEVDLWIIKGKAYMALVERENSVLYAGASLGYWNLQADTIGDVDGWSIAPLIGAEWNFAELPEIGINFEVSYEITDLETDAAGGGGTDIGISGINVTTGIVYYF